MEIRSNVLNKEITNKIIKETLKDIASCLANSLGPYGSTSIIEDQILNHVISKDGYTILNKFMYDNEVSQTVLEIIKKISRSLVREVGDGSTSSIIIAAQLYIEIEKILSETYVSPKLITKILKIVEKILEEEIKNKSIPITEDNFEKIEDIATISNNNDRELGKLIADLYRKIGVDGFITLENSKTDKDYYEIKDGYEINRGYIHTIFANSKNKMDCEFDKPLIFICNDTLREEDLEFLKEMVGQVCLSLQLPLIIVAKDYDSEVVNFLKINKIQNRGLNLSAIDHSMANKFSQDCLGDFASYVGATIYDKFSGTNSETFDMSILGNCEKAIITEKNSKFINGGGDEKDIEERIQVITESYNEMKIADQRHDRDEELYNLQRRISSLNCNIATFYVGGNSEIEKENRKYLLEDSVYACQSTIKNGYIIGGNLIIPMIIAKSKTDIYLKVVDELKKENICDEGLVEDLINSIDKAFRKGFLTVLNNYCNRTADNEEIVDKCVQDNTIYNLTNFEEESIDTTTIINSSSTDIEIMKATFSIIGLLATSNQFVSRSIIRDMYYE